MREFLRLGRICGTDSDTESPPERHARPRAAWENVTVTLNLIGSRERPNSIFQCFEQWVHNHNAGGQAGRKDEVGGGDTLALEAAAAADDVHGQ